MLRMGFLSWIMMATLACSSPKPFTALPAVPEMQKPGGSAFYAQAAACNWQQRDSLASAWFNAGFIPRFLQHFVPVTVHGIDSARGRKIKLVYYVSPDYFSLGNDGDWARVPITPMLSQQVAQQLGCIMTTTRMADDIYAAAKVKLPTVPMYAFRDSTVTMWHHHLIIEGQRKGRKGLIAGIKKDVVITEKLATSRPDRVAIYGWHKPDGRPIQPLYTGHVNWYVDYSHGTRLVSRRIKVNGKWMDVEAVAADPALLRLLTHESKLVLYPY